MKTILESDLRTQGHAVLDHQRRTVKDVVQQERGMFTLLASGMSPVILQEVALIKEVEQMEEVVDRMNKVLFDRQKCDEEYEHVLVAKHDQFSFSTPPSTPGGSLMGSRTGSVRSLNSFSSRPSSVASDSVVGDTDSLSRSRNNSVSSYQSLHQSNSNNKRCSTISTKSRDSGFSSQEILLLKQQQDTLKQVGINRIKIPIFVNIYEILNIFPLNRCKISILRVTNLSPVTKLLQFLFQARMVNFLTSEKLNEITGKASNSQITLEIRYSINYWLAKRFRLCLTLK